MKSIVQLRILPIVASFFFFLISLLLGGYEVTSIGQSGLPRIQLPFSTVSFLLLMVATGLVLFALCFNAVFRDPVAALRRAVIGSILVSSGFTAILFSSLVSWMQDTDYATRCSNYCGQALIGSYLQTWQDLSVGIALGVILTAIGLWLLTRAISSEQKASRSTQKPRLVEDV